MLVKLGNVWVDPQKVIGIHQLSVPYHSEDIPKIITVHMASKDLSYEVTMNPEDTMDDYANIINTAVGDKQSWSEEVSAPDETP